MAKRTDIEPNWTVVVCDKGQPFDMTGHTISMQIMPIELHVKPDGDKDNKPSYAFLLVDVHGNKYVAQISRRMLEVGLEEAKKLMGE